MDKPLDFHTRYAAEARRDNVIIWGLVAVIAVAVTAPLVLAIVGSWLHIRGFW
jgi:hypothetical protein